MIGSLFWAPDVDPRTRGALSVCGNLFPTSRGGYRPFRAAVDLGMPAVPTAPTSGEIVQLLSGSTRVFASSNTNIYELTNPLTTPSWTSQFTLVSATGQVGIFTQYADATVFTNFASPTVISTTSGGFSTLTGASKALTACVVNNIMLLVNYNDGSAVLDGFHASDLEDISSAGWTVGTAGSYAMKGRLIDTPGALTAAVGLNDQAILFKRRGVYVGQFTRDLTNPWDFRCVSKAIGCVGPKAVMVFRDQVTWVSDDDIYIYDGAQIRSITQGMRRTAFASVQTGSVAWQIMHDETENTLIYFYKSGSAYSWFAYNYISEKWSNGAGYNGGSAGPLAILNVSIVTNAAIVSSSRKTAFVIASDDNKIKKFDGEETGTNSAAAFGSIFGWAGGDGNKEYEATRLRCMFGVIASIEPDAASYPDGSSAFLYYGDTLAVTSNRQIGNMQSDGTCDGGVSARWIVPQLVLSTSTAAEDYIWELHDMQLVCGDEELPCIGGRR